MEEKRDLKVAVFFLTDLCAGVSACSSASVLLWKRAHVTACVKPHLLRRTVKSIHYLILICFYTPDVKV